MNYSSFSVFSIIILFCVIFCSCFIIPFSKYYPEAFGANNETHENISISDEYIWPVPGYTKISSYFGKRTSPTAGASSFHKGLDIPAPAGTNLVAIGNGKISFTGFSGSGGYTITYTCQNYVITYHHVSPNYIVSINDTVYKGQIIGQVGPKNVYGIPNNPYKDKNGNPTNGSTTGSHLHFAVKKEGAFIDPFELF